MDIDPFPFTPKLPLSRAAAGMAQARQVGWPVAKDDIQMTEQ
jgi:hypothetical protein